MEFTNLLSILESKNNLSEELFKKYLEYLNVNLEDNETEDLLKLIEKLSQEYQNSDIFDGYYIGYQIPQISKEFDLLRITNNSVINIELKSGASNESIKNQLIENKYYLKSLGRDKLYNITYKSLEGKIYILTDNGELEELDVTNLVKLLKLEPPSKEDLDLLFDPSEFLVSPINNTDKFIRGEYFLTGRQKEFKNSIIKIVKESGHGSCAISGKAGTGKTLLVYDIAKEITLDQKKVLIVHCGNLSEGHKKLRDNHEIDLISIKSFTEIRINSDYKLIIFDEAQRIHFQQLDMILKHKEKFNYLFSYDPTQILSSKDGKYGSRTASELYKNIKNHFELSEHIRTNKEMASFIKRLVDKKDNKSTREYKDITIQYFENVETAEDFIKKYQSHGWTYISYTPKMHGQGGSYQKYNINSIFSQTAHEVIGQEFDNVVVIVGKNFSYNSNGILSYDRSEDTSLPYLPHKMLFQAITRVRKKLKIIIINNPDILERCIEILSTSKST